MKRSSAGYNGFGAGGDSGGGRLDGASSTGSGRSGGNTLGKIKKSLTRRLSVSSRRSSNSSIETPRGSGRVDQEFQSLTGSDYDPQPRVAEQVSRVEVIFPIPAPPAPRGAPHGEPLTPLPPTDGRGSNGASEAGTAQVDTATTQVDPVKQSQTSIAAPATLPGGNENVKRNAATPETIAASSATGGTKTATSGAATVTSAGYSARDALRAERIADDEAVVAARAQEEAAARATSSARAAQEAASRASLAVAAATAAAVSSGSVSSAGVDESTGLPYADEDDSGFGPLPDLDFADRVWRARPQGQTRILSRVEMSVMSSSSSQSSRRDMFDGAASERSTATVGTRRSGGGGGDGTREGAGGAMREIEEEKQISSMAAEGVQGGEKAIIDGVTRRDSNASSNGSKGSRSRSRRSARTYNRRHSDGEDRVGDSQNHAAPSGSLELPSALKSQSQATILATPARVRSSRHTVTPRSAGRRNTHRPRSKKPRDSMGLMASGSSLRPSEEGQRQFEPPGPPKRRWQKWMGNNKFFCNGRIMLGVHYRQLITTALLLLASWIVFFIFILPEYGEWYYVVVAVCLCIGGFVALVYSSFLDPGIIPRRAATGLADSIPPDVRDQLNYCITCHIVRPPRTKHCKHCNNCVLAFDHHCPWTGNCVGARNYRAFMAFIILVTLSSSFVCTLSILHVLTRTVHVGPAGLTDAAEIPGSRLASPALSLWTAMTTLLVGALLGFHVYLLSKGQTTNEYLRGEKRRGNVPHRSFFPNCGQLWCGHQPPSMLPDMTEFPSDHEAVLDVNYAVSAYTELQDVIESRGDMV